MYFAKEDFRVFRVFRGFETTLREGEWVNEVLTTEYTEYTECISQS